MEIEFGKIQEICSSPTDENGDPTTCRVIPERNTGVVTEALYIPFYWRKRFGNLKIDDDVCYAVKANGTGAVLSKLDGEWDGIVRNDGKQIEMSGDIKVGGKVTAEGEIQGSEVKNTAGTKLGTHMHPTAAQGAPSSPTPGT